MTFRITSQHWYTAEVIGRVFSMQKSALIAGAGEILRVANKTVPFKEGMLAGSGAVDADEMKATVSYDTPYAVRLHQNPTYQFNFGRRGKWLELAFGEARDSANLIMAETMRRGFV